jgi:hypothetical protein
VTEEGPEESGTPLEPGNRFCELRGSLLYLANTVRPDIAQAVGVLSRYRGSPTAHWRGALRVVRYLLGTKSYGLKLGGSDVPLQGFVDANFAGDLDDRKSTTGFVFLVYGGAVSWRSKRQGAVTTSTVEAEYMAASSAIKEAAWLRGLQAEFEIPVFGISLYCDNSGCIQNLKNAVTSPHTKHISVAFHFAREQILLENIQVEYVRSERNCADMFTKPLSADVFKKHRDSINVTSSE